MAKKSLKMESPVNSFIDSTIREQKDKELLNNIEEIKKPAKKSNGVGRPKVANKKLQYSVTMSPELYSQARGYAEEMNISFSALMNMAVIKFMK